MAIAAELAALVAPGGVPGNMAHLLLKHPPVSFLGRPLLVSGLPESEAHES